MKVNFGTRSNGYSDVQWEVSTVKDAWEVMHEQVKAIGLEWGYANVNFDPNEKWFEVDFGSWSQFFMCTEMSEDNWKEFMGEVDEVKGQTDGDKTSKIGIPISATEVGKEISYE